MIFRAQICRATLLVGLFTIPFPAAAQPEYASDGELLGANALIGGALGGVAALIRGDSPVVGFASGLGGGALSYAGKRIASDRRFGAGLIGRQVASVGSSIVGNAVAGRGSFDRVALGFGPVRVYIGPAVPDNVRWRLNAPAAAFALWGIIEPDIVWDVGHTISSGSLVFRVESGSTNFAAPGTIFYSPSDADRVLPHERIHVLQYDQAFLSLSDPFEGWLSRSSSFTASLHRYLEFNIVGLSAGVAGLFVWDQHARPWEIEARSLTRRDRGSEYQYGLLRDLTFPSGRGRVPVHDSMH